MNRTQHNDTINHKTNEKNPNVPYTYLQNRTDSPFVLVLIGIALIVITVFVAIVINWAIKERKYRELRHRLIPLYTFDPNEEEDWEVQLLNQENGIFAQQKSPDYHSVDNEREYSLNAKHKYDLV